MTNKDYGSIHATAIIPVKSQPIKYIDNQNTGTETRKGE